LACTFSCLLLAVQFRDHDICWVRNDGTPDTCIWSVFCSSIDMETLTYLQYNLRGNWLLSVVTNCRMI
jgi:hypothetical protein